MKRVLAVLMCLLMVIPCALADAPAQKEEVIYATLDANGNVTGTYAVNIFNLTEPAHITDFGDYSQIKNLTDLAPLAMENGEVSFDTTARCFYYQGKLENASLPWNIHLAYTLDGQPAAPQEIAGASGRIGIVLDMTKNDQCTGDYFENLLAQVSVTLSCDKCFNIDCPGATAANAGTDKTLSYMGMPGEGLHAELSFDAENFSMSGISIAALPFALTMQAPDMSAFTGQLTTLTDTVSGFSLSVSSVSGTLNTLTLSAGKLSKGLKAAADAVRDADASQAATLDQLQADAALLSSDLTDAAKALNTTKVAAKTLTTMTDNLPQQVDDTVNQLLSSYDKSTYSPVSFADARNGQILSLQFVLALDGIAPAAQVQEEAEEVPSTFLTRLMSLFKK